MNDFSDWTFAFLLGVIVALLGVLAGREMREARRTPEIEEPLPAIEPKPCRIGNPVPGRTGRWVWLVDCPEGYRPGLYVLVPDSTEDDR